MEFIKGIILHIGIIDIIDIFIVAVIIYRIALLIHETRAEQLMKGIAVLLIATFLSTLFQLNTLSYILQQTMTVGIIALLIVFQPELRRVLEYLGRSKFLTNANVGDSGVTQEKIVEDLVLSCEHLAQRRIGALILIERQTGLNEYIKTGIQIDGDISKELLINTFIPNTPLHDGAMIIEKTKIRAAACILPLSDNLKLSKELGTRHRAGVGISEICDCLSIIVSEETGGISLAENGVLQREVDISVLKEKLTKIYISKIKTQNKKRLLWRQPHEKDSKNIDE